MAEVGHIETGIAREESSVTLPAKEDDNLFVLEALTANVDSNLPGCQPGCIQQQPLPLKNVFVEDDQA